MNDKESLRIAGKFLIMVALAAALFWLVAGDVVERAMKFSCPAQATVAEMEATRDACTEKGGLWTIEYAEIYADGKEYVRHWRCDLTMAREAKPWPCSCVCVSGLSGE